MIVALHGLGADSGQTALSLGTPLMSGGATFAMGGSLLTAGVTAGIGLVAAAIALWISRKGPKQNVATTSIVDQVEPYMRQNLAAWQASAKSCADQAQALANFDALWGQVVQACANPALGDPGHSCIDDRLPAGVTFTFNSFHLVGNGMHNWFAYYRDPIANDAAAANCCPAAPCYFPGCSPIATGCVPSSAISPADLLGTGAAGFSWSTLLIPAVLGGLVIWGLS